MGEQLGCFIIDLAGKAVNAEERELLQHPLVGGVILFSRNFESASQLRALCLAIKAARKMPLLIMVDQEGGRVQRFIQDFTRLPNMGLLGKLYDQAPLKASQLAKECGWLMATELLSCGVDLSLAPVLDLNRGKNTVIGNRAFHADPTIVIILAEAFIEGMREAGMGAVGKHFPGHGGVSEDSHLSLPIDERSLDQIAREDMLPFSALIQKNLSGLMAAHIRYPAIDNLPVGFSSFWLQTILRQQLGFKGAIFSDDLNMEGANISTSYADRFLLAREAGCDFVLLCNNRQGVIQVLDNVSAPHFIEKEKWGVLVGKHSLSGNAYHTLPRWQQTRDLLTLTMQEPH